jgi:hypothetical protein
MTEQQAREQGFEVGTIQALYGSWGSGLAHLEVQTEHGSEVLMADNGPLVRALDAAFGGVIQPNHRASVSHIQGQPIAFSVDHMGIMVGFDPIEPAGGVTQGNQE